MGGIYVEVQFEFTPNCNAKLSQPLLLLLLLLRIISQFFVYTSIDETGLTRIWKVDTKRSRTSIPNAKNAANGPFRSGVGLVPHPDALLLV